MQHHAILLLGTMADALARLPSDVQLQGADVRHIELEQLGIEETRTLRSEATRRPIEKMYRTFVVAFSRATSEAQNALLKTLEEPAPTSRFYIVVPHESVLISTVRSRLSAPDISPVQELTREAKEFLSVSYGNRLVLVTERTKVKGEPWAAAVLGGLEVWANRNKDTLVMKDLIMLQRYILSQGGSKKMLFEHLALSVPPSQQV